MRKLMLRSAAARDLGLIADYTISEFGIAQARRYRDQFDACFASICDNPMLGRSADDLQPGMRQLRQQAHLIFYIHDQNSVTIIRVLHALMDAGRHIE